jgi:hypothetical protein
MVLGENDLGFATRGSLLIAFNVRNGKEAWHWDSNTPGIEVFAALANGHCLVQTPTALVEVENGDKSKEIFQGKAMMAAQLISQKYLTGSPAHAEVVSRFYDVFLLLLATGFLPVDSLYCFGSGSFSNFRLSFGYVIAPLLAVNRQFAAFLFA